MKKFEKTITALLIALIIAPIVATMGLRERGVKADSDSALIIYSVKYDIGRWLAIDCNCEGVNENLQIDNRYLQFVDSVGENIEYDGTKSFKFSANDGYVVIPFSDEIVPDRVVQSKILLKKGLKIGNATLQCDQIWTAGELDAESEIILYKVEISRFEASEEKFVMTVGTEQTLNVFCEPYPESFGEKITYYSSNKKVATVKDGKVKAIGVGNAKIKVSILDVEKEIVVIVKSGMPSEWESSGSFGESESMSATEESSYTPTESESGDLSESGVENDSESGSDGESENVNESEGDDESESSSESTSESESTSTSESDSKEERETVSENGSESESVENSESGSESESESESINESEGDGESESLSESVFESVDDSENETTIESDAENTTDSTNESGNYVDSESGNGDYKENAKNDNSESELVDETDRENLSAESVGSNDKNSNVKDGQDGFDMKTAFLFGFIAVCVIGGTAFIFKIKR